VRRDELTILPVQADAGCDAETGVCAIPSDKPERPSMTRNALLVTGASGHLGRRILDLLLAEGTGPIIATTRKPESLAEYAAKGVEVRRASFADDQATLAAAFKGVGRALLVSTDDLSDQRLPQQVNAVKALEAAGATHIVYTSLPRADSSLVLIAPDHAGTEKAIAQTKLGYTFLRNNLYAEMLFFSLPGALASGQLVDARGNGKTAFVTREDCARVAAAVLAGTKAERAAYDITGPEALTSGEVVAIASEVLGKPLRHLSVAKQARIDGAVQHGLRRHVAEIVASFDVSIATGQFETVTDAVMTLTGKKPQSLRGFIAGNREAFLAPPKSLSAHV
jgi:NAD(P)H dehydrogenase (quinone)